MIRGWGSGDRVHADRPERGRTRPGQDLVTQSPGKQFWCERSQHAESKQMLGMGQGLGGQILLITMLAINDRKSSTGRHHLPAHIDISWTDSSTSSAEQTPGKDILIDSSLPSQLRNLGQMDLAPGGMGLATGNPIDRADHRTGPAFGTGIHGLQVDGPAAKPASSRAISRKDGSNG